MMTSVPSLEEYSDVMELITHTNRSLDTASLPYAYYDAIVSQLSLGVPVTNEIYSVLPRLKEAAGISIGFIYGDEDTVNLLAGVLLNEFFTYSSSLISGADTPRVRVYSAHDVNVFGLMSAVKVYPSQGVPEYASAFALELRKVEATQQYVVLAVYKPDPSVELVYLPIPGCDLLCDLDQFYQLVSKNLLDEDTWRTDCGFTNDLEIDTSSLD